MPEEAGARASDELHLGRFRLLRRLIQAPPAELLVLGRALERAVDVVLVASEVVVDGLVLARPAAEAAAALRHVVDVQRGPDPGVVRPYPRVLCRARGCQPWGLSAGP